MIEYWKKFGNVKRDSVGMTGDNRMTLSWVSDSANLKSSESWSPLSNPCFSEISKEIHALKFN
jgi:hypothetical protein